jgi:predicted  nucleic acid-binding Zn-ribbon protein
LNNEPALLRQHAIIDNQIRLIRADVQVARDSVSQQTDILQSNNTMLTSLLASKAENKKSTLSLERDIGRYSGQRKAAERIVESGNESANTALKQIEKCQSLIDTTETKVLMLIEEDEALDSQVAATKNQIAETTRVLHQAKIHAKETISVGKKQFTIASSHRNKVRTTLPDYLVTRYDTLFTRRGTAVAYLRDSACSSCHSVSSASCLAEIARGRLASCRRCGRWLVKDKE